MFKPAIKNLVTNGGNLVNTTGWTASATNVLSAVAGRLRNTLGVGNYGYAYQEVSFVSDHKYYFRVSGYIGDSTWRATVYSSGGALLQGSDPAMSTDSMYSVVYTALSTDNVKIRLYTDTIANYVYAEFNHCILIDLTARFGAGNEPNLAWCDANIAPHIIY